MNYIEEKWLRNYLEFHDSEVGEIYSKFTNPRDRQLINSIFRFADNVRAGNVTVEPETLAGLIQGRDTMITQFTEGKDPNDINVIEVCNYYYANLFLLLWKLRNKDKYTPNYHATYDKCLNLLKESAVFLKENEKCAPAIVHDTNWLVGKMEKKYKGDDSWENSVDGCVILLLIALSPLLTLLFI